MGILVSENQISIYKGESATLNLSVVDSDNRVVDLTDGRVIMSVKNDIKDQFALIQKTSDSISQIELTAPRSGKATIYLNASDTSGIDVKQYVFDIWVKLNTNKQYMIVKPSVFEVLESVTIFG